LQFDLFVIPAPACGRQESRNPYFWFPVVTGTSLDIPFRGYDKLYGFASGNAEGIKRRKK
jgi:hypothetical protein